MIKKTFKELKEFNGYSQMLLRAKPELQQTKLGYSIKRFVEKNLTKIFKDYNDELDIIRIDHALVDEKTKAILQAPETSIRPYLYGKEELKAVMKAENALMEKWDKKEFDIEPFICKEIPEGIGEDYLEAFKGLVIE